MKKQLLTTASILMFGLFANAQNNNANLNATTGANWKSNGNAAATSDFVGTTNAQDLIFRTNNQERLLLDQTGNLIIKDRINPGNGGGGEIIISPGQLHRSIPTNPIAAYMLKVGGSGIFEGELNAKQLFVEDYITFMKSLKGPRIDVDSIKMDSTRGIYGHTKIFGNVEINQKLTVQGDAIFKSNLTAEQGLTFSGTTGIKQFANPDGSTSIKYGNINTTLGTQQICAAQPYAYVNHQFGGWMQIFNADAAGNYVPNSGLLNFQTWTGGSSIDASIGGQTGGGGLLLNYFCGNNTFINTGANGGEVFMGKTHIGGVPSASAPHANALLSVGGDVVAKAVYVTQKDWADFVFDPTYQLMPFNELQSYYQANKHLPNVPSTKEISENGNDLANTDKILLQKIEESYLYMAEMKKQIEELKEKNTQLELQLNKLTK